MEASAEGSTERRRTPPTNDAEVLDDWMRDTHDLWHVVTGYQGDLVGEAAILAFSFAQTRHPGVGLIVLGALYEASRYGSIETEVDPRWAILQGFVRGVRSDWLVAQDWEALLSQPLDDVRRRLRVGPPPHYTPVRAQELQIQAA